MSVWSDVERWLGFGLAEEATGTAPSTPVTNWLGSLGGDIASGLEGGLVQLLHDMWNVIVAPLAIIAGVILILLAFAWFFKDDILGAARMAGQLAAMA